MMRRLVFLMVALAVLWPARSLHAQMNDYDIDVAARIVVVFRAAAPPFATLGDVNGGVLVRRSGSPVWTPAVSGTPLTSGDSVQTRSGASAIIEFVDGGRVRLTALSEVVVGSVSAAGGARADVLAITRGRAWARINVEEENTQFIVQANNAVINGQRMGAFFEADGNQEAGCFDLFNGSATVRSKENPDNSITLEAHQRAHIKPGQDLQQPVAMTDAFDDSQTRRSCLNAESKQQQAAPETIEGAAFEEPAQTTVTESEDEMVFELVAVTSVMFSNPQVETVAAAPVELTSKDGSLIFVAEDSALAAQPAADGTATTSTVPEEDQYETVEIVKIANLSFTKPPPPEPKCTGAPELGGVTVNGQSVVSGATVALDSLAKCGYSAKPVIKWTATPKCGNITTMSLIVDSTSSSFAGAAAGEKAAAEKTIDIADGAAKNISIKALDSVGSDVSISFSIQVNAGEKPAPSISGVSVNGSPVAQAGAIDVPAETCGLTTIKLSGAVTSGCGAIQTVKITAGKTVVGVTGTSAWSGSFTAAKGQTVPVTIEAADSSGSKAETYKFDVNAQQKSGEKPPIALTGAAVNGIPVSQGGSVDVASDACGAVAINLTGSAASLCGTVQTVKVTANRALLDVRGGSAWSGFFTANKAMSIPVTVDAVDSTGAKAEPMAFEINFAKNTAPPTANVELIGKTAVNAFSSAFDIYRTDLVDGKLDIAGSAVSAKCRIVKAEASVNGGSTWVLAEGTNRWTYRLSPREETYEVIARATDEDGNVTQDAGRAVEFAYHAKTDEDNLREVFAKMLRAYQDKDTATFLDYTASNFTTKYDSIEDKSRLDTSLNNKFAAFTTIYLRSQISSVIVTGTSGRVMFQWDADSAAAGFGNSGAFVFTKGTDGWRLITVEDDRTFLRYTSVVARVQLESSKATVIADKKDTAFITARVYDSANNPAKDGTEVKFTATMGAIPAVGYTANGEAVVTYTGGAVDGSATITATAGSVGASITVDLKAEHAPLPPE